MAHLNKQRQINYSYSGTRNERYSAKEAINPQIATAIQKKTDWPEYREIPLLEQSKKKARAYSQMKKIETATFIPVSISRNEDL